MTKEDEEKNLVWIREVLADPTAICTCANCEDKHTCCSSYDPYNTDGDCLESK